MNNRLKRIIRILRLDYHKAWMNYYKKEFENHYEKWMKIYKKKVE